MYVKVSSAIESRKVVLRLNSANVAHKDVRRDPLIRSGRTDDQKLNFQFGRTAANFAQ